MFEIIKNVEPSYNKRALNRYCKGIPMTATGAKKLGLTDHCPCRLSWLCDGLFGSHMLNDYDTSQVELKELHFPVNFCVQKDGESKQ